MKPDQKYREALEEMARESDRIVNLILHTNMPRVDIDIQIENLRDACTRRYPGSEELFEMIYASRFRRIWEQWARDRPQPDDVSRAAWNE